MTSRTTPADHGRRIWSPDPARRPSQMTAFRQWISSRRDTPLDTYADLHRWSVENPAQFWEALYDYFGIESPTPYDTVMSDGPMWDVRWFEGASVNYARNILRALRDDPDKTAIIVGDEAGKLRHVSRAELLRDVEAAGAYLTHIGVGKGSRVAAYVSSNAASVVAFLACAAIGAVWSSVSPDFGTAAVCDRLEQFAPQLLIATDGYVFGGRPFDRIAAVDEILGRIGSIERVVHIASSILPSGWSGFARPTVAWEEMLQQGRDMPFAFAEVDFGHPLITCFSSGTTGKPKGIVHGQMMVKPPSTARICPVTWAPASDAKSSAAPFRSPGPPSLPSGVCATMSPPCASMTASAIFDGKYPGAIALTRTPRPSSITNSARRR